MQPALETYFYTTCQIAQIIVPLYEMCVTVRSILTYHYPICIILHKSFSFRVLCVRRIGSLTWQLGKLGINSSAWFMHVCWRSFISTPWVIVLHRLMYWFMISFIEFRFVQVTNLSFASMSHNVGSWKDCDLFLAVLFTTHVKVGIARFHNVMTQKKQFENLFICIGVFPKWSGTFSAFRRFRESKKSLKH